MKWLPQGLAMEAIPPECRETYWRHRRFAVCDALAAGILANTPVMALKSLASQDWQLAIQLPISSVGMFLVLYLSGIMARRNPMPFAVVPGLAYGVTSLAMAFTGNPLWFLILGGVGTLLETISRPAVTAILRLNYPAAHRGAITGRIRQWHLCTFLAAGSGAAWLLDQFKGSQLAMIQWQLVLAGIASLVAFLCFQTIRVQAGKPPSQAAAASEAAVPFGPAWQILRRDPRFRAYLIVGFLYAAGGLIYVAYVPVIFHRLQLGYFASALLLNTLPTMLSVLTTSRLGAWMDRVNSWRAWAVIRLGWGLDALLLAAAIPLAAISFPLAILLIILGRCCRGTVMGSSWILWWQVGVNHFAPPPETARYLGLILFVNGLARLAGPALGAALLQGHCPLAIIFGLGGLLVILSAWLSRTRELAERRHSHLQTVATFEITQPATGFVPAVAK
jgi:MFS family permease